VFAAVYLLLWLLSWFRLKAVQVGPARVESDSTPVNAFDQHLDEIIYFFQQTKTRVVFFEDLDRFNNLGIFIALRELNELINASTDGKGTRKRRTGVDSDAVTFVYAIGDQVFARPKSMKRGTDTGQTTPTNERGIELDGAPEADDNPLHSAAEDRAKFFDLIVPVVPFASQEVAADLFATIFNGTPVEGHRELFEIAGRYFTDMRVIKNIKNEFIVFARELLAGKEDGLEPDKLLALVLFKNQRPDDFERIRTGTSSLDLMMAQVSQRVEELLTHCDEQLASMRNAEEEELRVPPQARQSGSANQSISRNDCAANVGRRVGEFSGAPASRCEVHS